MTNTIIWWPNVDTLTVFKSIGDAQQAIQEDSVTTISYFSVCKTEKYLNLKGNIYDFI